MDKDKYPKLIKKEKIDLSNADLVDLMREVLARGGKFRFQAKGASMSPFIKAGDILTIFPVKDTKSGIGKIVACLEAQQEKLLVHRIVAKKNGAYLIKGDNSDNQSDGWFYEQSILGVVGKVERGQRTISLGLGWERWLIAFLSKKGILGRIINRLRKYQKMIKGRHKTYP